MITRKQALEAIQQCPATFGQLREQFQCSSADLHRPLEYLRKNGHVTLTPINPNEGIYRVRDYSPTT